MYNIYGDNSFGERSSTHTNRKLQNMRNYAGGILLDQKCRSLLSISQVCAVLRPALMQVSFSRQDLLPPAGVYLEVVSHCPRESPSSTRKQI